MSIAAYQALRAPTGSVAPSRAIGAAWALVDYVGLRVRHLRRAAGLTQEGLADAADVDRRYLARIETGSVREPGLETLQKIAKALDLPVRSIAPVGYYEEAAPSWETALLQDPRFSDEDKAALLRAGRAMIRAGDIEDGRREQAG